MYKRADEWLPWLPVMPSSDCKDGADQDLEVVCSLRGFSQNTSKRAKVEAPVSAAAMKWLHWPDYLKVRPEVPIHSTLFARNVAILIAANQSCNAL